MPNETKDTASEKGMHTATPWALGFADDKRAFVNAKAVTVCKCDLGGDEGERLTDPRANAEFIVTAVNCHATLLQALREVIADSYYLPNPGERARCSFCQVDEGDAHEPECTMEFVLAAVAMAEEQARA